MHARRPLFRSLLLAAAIAAFASGATLPASAQNAAGSPACPAGKVCLINPISARTVPELIANIVKTAVGIVGAIALLVFVYGGFIWLTSRGESGKVAAGKEAMKWAAVGLAVIFTSYGLVRFVFSALTG